jgi:hypothetical protein
MMWAALFQQRPAPEDGDYFKADWLKPYVNRPEKDEIRIYALLWRHAVDLALDGEQSQGGRHRARTVYPINRRYSASGTP